MRLEDVAMEVVIVLLDEPGFYDPWVDLGIDKRLEVLSKIEELVKQVDR